MADEVDHANDMAELHLQAIIRAAQAAPAPQYTGRCRWCAEPTNGAYCSPECQDDHRKREHLK